MEESEKLQVINDEAFAFFRCVWDFCSDSYYITPLYTGSVGLHLVYYVHILLIATCDTHIRLNTSRLSGHGFVVGISQGMDNLE